MNTKYVMSISTSLRSRTFKGICTPSPQHVISRVSLQLTCFSPNFLLIMQGPSQVDPSLPSAFQQASTSSSFNIKSPGWKLFLLTLLLTHYNTLSSFFLSPLFSKKFVSRVFPTIQGQFPQLPLLVSITRLMVDCVPSNCYNALAMQLVINVVRPLLHEIEKMASSMQLSFKSPNDLE